MEHVPLTHERLKFLSTLRLDAQLQAQRQAISLNMKKNEERQPLEFEEGRLVLCRFLPLDRLKYRTAFHKAVPRWTIPYRVSTSYQARERL